MAQVATPVFGRLLRDEAGATLLFANAGHLPPILRRHDGSVHAARRGTSTLIGVLEPGERPRNEAALTLPEGSLLLLYTDGLVETREREYDAGINDLCAALAALDPQADPDQACETLLAALVGDHQEDDIALLAVRIDPLPTPT